MTDWNTLSYLDRQFREALNRGERSLLLSSFSLSPQECEEIRDYSLNPKYNNHTDLVHLRMAVFFRDFFEKSDGREYRTYWGEGTNEKDFDRVWGEIYGKTAVKLTDRTRYTLVKTKCWALNTAERQQCCTPGAMRRREDGRHSILWKCLAKAVNAFREGEEMYSVAGESIDEVEYFTLLMKDDTIERREFLWLVEWLAHGKIPTELQGQENDASWQRLYRACEAMVTPSAWVDWYLRIPADGPAEFGIGFDGFPDDKKNAAWRHYQLDGDAGNIDTMHQYFAPAALSSCTKLSYMGKTWNTMDGKETDSVLFPLYTVPFGVFIRYRQDRPGSKDARRFWWREADRWWDEKTTPPELHSHQSDILICARQREDLTGIQVVCDNPSVRVELVREDYNQVFHGPDDDREAFPVHIYRVTARPHDKDETVQFLHNGNCFCRITVLGLTPVAKVQGNINGIELANTNKQQVAFPGHVIKMQVTNARPDKSYRWKLELNGQVRWEDEAQATSICLREVLSNCDSDNLMLATWRITCQEIGGERVNPSAEGIVLSDGMHDRLLDGLACPDNWQTGEPEDYTPIPDWIAGKRRVRINHADKNLEVLIPLKKPVWWFEIGHKSYRDNEGLWSFKGRKFFADGELPADDIPILDEQSTATLSLCVPDLGNRPGEKWHQTSEGYWRCRVADLIGASTMNPEWRYTSSPERHAFVIQGTIFFRYVAPMPTRAMFCLDEKGHLGLFVPEHTLDLYDIIAFSDQTPELLTTGEKLGQTLPQERFHDVQERWDGFCERMSGHDALLGAFPLSGSAKHIMSSTPPCCRVNQGRGMEPYRSDMLRVVESMKFIADVIHIPPEHPVRKMRILSTPQTATLETIRANWENQVDLLCQNAACSRTESWKTLLEAWIAAGFYPVLEGIAGGLLEKVREGYLRFNPPELPKTNGRNTPSPSAWADFVRWWWNATASDSRNCDARLKQDLGYKGRLDGVKDEIKRILPDFKRQCESFIQKDPFFSGTDYPWTQRMQQELSGPNPSAERLAYLCELNNTVRENEFSFENGPNILPFPDGAHLSPIDVLKGLAPSGNAGVTLMIASLELMGQRRRVSNWQTETPTDREWVFCLAAAVCSGKTGGKLPPILQRVASVAANEPKNPPSKLDYFHHFFHVCQACMNPPERNQR